jgi:hypothetical protein
MLLLGMILLAMVSSEALPETEFTNELKKYRPVGITLLASIGDSSYQ